MVEAALHLGGVAERIVLGMTEHEAFAKRLLLALTGQRDHRGEWIAGGIEHRSRRAAHKRLHRCHEGLLERREQLALLPSGRELAFVVIACCLICFKQLRAA